MKIGISVECSVCHRTKAPRGRSVPMAMNGTCAEEWRNGPDACVGYSQDPQVGDLWPGETEADFGYPIGPNGTRDMTEQEMEDGKSYE